MSKNKSASNWVLALAVLLAFGTSAVSVQAQGHYKSFIVSTYATQGTVQGLMNGNPARSPGPS